MYTACFAVLLGSSQFVTKCVLSFALTRWEYVAFSSFVLLPKTNRRTYVSTLHPTPRLAGNDQNYAARANSKDELTCKDIAAVVHWSCFIPHSNKRDSSQQSPSHPVSSIFNCYSKGTSLFQDDEEHCCGCSFASTPCDYSSLVIEKETYVKQRSKS